MVGVKKLIVLKKQISDVFEKLRSQGYNHITFYLDGHPKHQQANLLPQQVLVHAWKYKPRPDKKVKGHEG